MHFYAVYYLCVKAGFDSEEAERIATSSQYVDDALESEQMGLTDGHSKYGFDPVCTQHMSLRSLGEVVSDKVYFPFHFMPAADLRHPNKKTITIPFDKNQAVRRVLDRALHSKNTYRIGIALHAMADSYSHENFSGEWSTINAIGRVRCIFRRRIMPKSPVVSFIWILSQSIKTKTRMVLCPFLPEIGHLKAYDIPDYPFAIWKYRDENGKVVIRNNPELYTACMMKLFGCLKQIRGSKKVEDQEERDIESTINKSTDISASLQKRVRFWRRLLRHEGYKTKYNPIQWKRAAFKENALALKEMKPMSKRVYRVRGTIEDFLKSDYYRFHDAAKNHRIEVLKAIQKAIPRASISLKETIGKNLFFNPAQPFSS